MDVDQSDFTADCIKVFIRVRPAQDRRCCFTVKSSRELEFHGQHPKLFQFDHVADQDATQDSVFDFVGRQIVESCVEGYNGTIFAYGQTGSGKTYTMLGPGEDLATVDRLKGLIPRSLDYLFELMNKKIGMHGKHFEFECRASFLEIYNEHVYDLLDQCQTRSLNLRECQTRGVFAEGRIEQSVSSSTDALSVLSEGWSNRKVSATAMNRESSRSHAVFTLTVETKEYTGGIAKVRQSVLNLVDLAGSERQKDARTTGIQLFEAGKINRSLSVLGQVITALDDIAHRKTRFVPYRDSKLTMLLRDSLGGNAKTFIIVNVHPNMQHMSETLSSLQFAQRAKQIKNRAIVNENTEGNLQQLQNELKRLKNLLLKYENIDYKQVINGSSSDDSAIISTPVPSEYRQRFLQAMEMLEHKNELVMTLNSEIEKLRRFNMSRTLILKLRDSAIAKYKKSTLPTRDEEIDALEQEIQHLNDQVLHHPDVGRYQAEITQLQSELNRYRQAGEKMTQVKVSELEELYAKLTSQSSVSSSKASIGRPSSGDENTIAHLEAKVRLGDKELEALKEKNSDLQAELNKSKMQLEELNNVLENFKDNSNIQFRKLHEIHDATLQRVIVTPKRNRSSIESGDYPLPSKIQKSDQVPCAKLLDLSMPESVLDESTENGIQDAPLIMDQSIPDIMDNGIEEALREELAQVKEDMERFREECLAKDKELVALRASETALKDKSAKSNDICVNLKKKLNELEELLNSLKSEKRADFAEICDLKIQLRSAHQEAECNVESLKTVQESFCQLEMKYLKSIQDFRSIQEEKERHVNEIQSLSINNETINLELSSVKNEMENLAEELEEEKKRCCKASSELETTKATLAREQSNYATLQEQLEGEVKVVAEEMKTLRDAKFKLESEISTLKDESESLKAVIKEKTLELVDSSKKNDELLSTVKSLRDKVLDHKDARSTLEAENSSLQAKFDELIKKFELSADEKDKLQEDYDAMKRSLEAERRDFEMDAEKHKFEMECIQEDLICLEEHASKLEASLRTKETEVSDATEKLQSFQTLLSESKAKLEQQENSVKCSEESKRLADEHIAKLKSELTEANLQNEECKKSCSALQEKVELKEKSLDQIKGMLEKEQEAKQIQDVTIKDMQEQLKTSELNEKEAIATIELLSQQIAKTKAVRDKEVEELRFVIATYSKEQENYQQNLKMAEEKQANLVQQLQKDLQEAKVLKEYTEEELLKMKQEKETLMTDVSSLAGHSNHQQKIHYLKKMRNKLHDVEKDNSKLHLQIRKLLATLKKHEPDFETRWYKGLAEESSKGLVLTEKNLNTK